MIPCCLWEEKWSTCINTPQSCPLNCNYVFSKSLDHTSVGFPNESFYSAWLTLGMHVQRGLLYLVCVSVCVCVCLSPLILALQGPSRLISNTNGSSTTRARKVMWRFCLNGGVQEIWRSRTGDKSHLPPWTADSGSVEHWQFYDGEVWVLKW